MARRMVFDVESIGLHGEAFAVAWVVLLDGKRVEEGWVACDPDQAAGTEEGRKWIMENVIGSPGLDAPLEGAPPVNMVDRPTSVFNFFWSVWQHQKAQGAELWADCAWPVEARLLIRAVDYMFPPFRKLNMPEGTRDWEGPYPLLDISTLVLACGLDPTAEFDRRVDEKPTHHPLADARQSARKLLECLEQLGIDP